MEVVILLSKLITQIAFILTSNTDHVFNAFGIIQAPRKLASTVACTPTYGKYRPMA